jgi:hypothetical protein
MQRPDISVQRSDAGRIGRTGQAGARRQTRGEYQHLHHHATAETQDQHIAERNPDARARAKRR